MHKTTRPAGVISTNGALTEVACKEATWLPLKVAVRSIPLNGAPNQRQHQPPALLNSNSGCQSNRLNCSLPSILLPLAKTQHRLLAAPRSSSCDPSVAEMMTSEAEAWAMGIALAEDALERIKPYGHVLVRYLHRLETVINAKTAVQL